jgi:transposase
MKELTILEPLWNAVQDVSQRIGEYDQQVRELEKKYPEAMRLQQIAGVGPVISLTFVLTLDGHQRFQKSRQVGSYLGLRPRQLDSGESQPQLRITKAGDKYLRSLLIQGAQYILGKFGPDTDLKRWGQKLAARGGKNAKKRAVVAVARKLAVLLHRLWKENSDYQPLRHSQAA